MFHRKSAGKPRLEVRAESTFTIEGLEGRRMLSASGHHSGHHAYALATPAVTASARHGHHRARHAVAATGTGSSTGSDSSSEGSSVLFADAPAAVQSGLTTLAASAGATLTNSTPVEIETEDGGATVYKAEVTDSTGKQVELVVDATGAAVTHGKDGSESGDSGGGTGSDNGSGSDAGSGSGSDSGSKSETSDQTGRS